MEEGGVEQANPHDGQPRVCYKHERAVPIQQTVEALDFREEGEEASWKEPRAKLWLSTCLLRSVFSPNWASKERFFHAKENIQNRVILEINVSLY